MMIPKNAETIGTIEILPRRFVIRAPEGRGNGIKAALTYGLIVEGSTCVHRVPWARTKTRVIPSVERGTWVGGVPTQVRWNPAHPGPSLDARDDRRFGFGYAMCETAR